MAEKSSFRRGSRRGMRFKPSGGLNRRSDRSGLKARANVETIETPQDEIYNTKQHEGKSFAPRTRRTGCRRTPTRIRPRRSDNLAMRKMATEVPSPRAGGPVAKKGRRAMVILRRWICRKSPPSPFPKKYSTRRRNSSAR